jgi:hypothetical protein
MPRRTRLKPWRGDHWKPFVYRAIERRVAGNIESIAAPLGIDDPTEREALAEAVTIELRRAWAYLRDVQSAASEPATRKLLYELLRAKDLVMEVERADPTVRRLIEEHDRPSGGKAFLEEIATDSQRLYKATSRALAAITKVKRRGHPAQRGQISEHVLAAVLAKIFERFGGRATRRFDAYGGYEYGPYRDFVVSVLEMVPMQLRRSAGRAKKQRDSVDYMVRLSARHTYRTPKKPSVYAGSGGGLFPIISSLPVLPHSPPDRDKS